MGFGKDQSLVSVKLADLDSGLGRGDLI